MKRKLQVRLMLIIGKSAGWILQRLGLTDWLMRRYGKALLQAVCDGPPEARAYFVSRAETSQGQSNLAEYGLAHDYRKVLDVNKESSCTE